MKKAPSQEEMMEQVQRLLEERGRKALEMARKTVLEEEIECGEVREALRYFMTEYWHDVARPALLSLACEAVGGDPEVTIPIAVPMTLISGAIDIHDDIIDQSKTKGSRPTVLGKFGKDLALLVGDALLFKGFTLLHEAVEKGIPAEKIAIILGIIKRTFFELGDAEALELKFRGRMDVTPEQYLRVVRKKAADVEAHTRISAILGGGSKEEIEALGEYGRLLGMMIILRDDLIDMIDLEETIHRVKKEYLPLPILYALQNSKIKSTLNSILLKKTLTKRDAKTILEVTDKAGGLEHVRKLMQKLATATYRSTENFKLKKEDFGLLSKAMLLTLGGRQNSTNPTI
ncbi:MAG: polyprenyl synthetase family protein [Candidatus Bathyarchaeota archaeon]|nr:polyprenyl synthetase family protein [Candidatus Bathyarchaeota archaeon]MDH5636036.1 polyprenyl synthetase family protein [Candidatus Bathyarchaeota archaeon]